MKAKFIAGVAGIAAIDIILFYTISDALQTGPLLAILLCILCAVLLALFVFQWVINPVLEMQQKVKKAEEENKKAETIRREFVANVTHELKTPLTSISGFIETLQDGAAENAEIRRRFLDIIAIETARLKRLIEDLLVLSDIENRREQNVERINIRQSLERTIEAIEPIAETHSIQIVTRLDQKHYIEGSEDRFSQMMLNLIENAIKYSGEGKHVFITSRDLEDRIQISIRDEGIGIESEHFERLFERFYRVDKSRSKKEGGTGLGLSIVKHIAVLFDAELKVESEPGKGSEFYVIFKKGVDIDGRP